jgi:(1->4)-alpha-D-glucan 1-alpha-D-glucosylmutase
MNVLNGSWGRIPSATYRLQFNAGFGFKQALAIVDYLRELGISDCYASPLFQACPGSQHGYDVCDFNRLSLALGTPEQFDRFSAELRHSGMGLLLDIVPNHMGADPTNPWWRDVLENGENSPFATWFDIRWRAPGLEGKVLLPVLEGHYARVLETGKLSLNFQSGRFAIEYYDRKFPLSPRSNKEVLAQLKSRKGLNSPTRDAISPDQLHGLLQQQHYCLAYWRIGPERINYRRFFDISELVSLRMELPEVFDATHELILRLVREGKVTGLRIDHPDGLWNPRQYLERIQAAVQSSAAPAYVVVEKILTGEESLPADWAVAGTTGYDFLNEVNGLFVDEENRKAFDTLYVGFTGRKISYADVVYASKKGVLLNSFISELDVLTRQLESLAAASRTGQDFTFRQLRAALVEVLAVFPVYRTYIDDKTARVSAAERDYVLQAIRSATTRAPVLDPEVLGFIERALLLEPIPDLGEQNGQGVREFIMRLQQLSGPLMAKGLEDTAFYNFNRLMSLNEVGGNPGRFGVGVKRFHDFNKSRCDHWPHALLTTATHDTKRGEDARARINVLSEMPQEWEAALGYWHSTNARYKTDVDGEFAPQANDEYLFYQSLIGAWEPEAENPARLEELRKRMGAYMLKAIKESKAWTSWTNPNRLYEEATQRFVDLVLSDSSDNGFLAKFKKFQHRVAFFGRFNSLSQTLLKMAAPGVPDFYQGTELWDFNLVDPDNRRPVDYERRSQLLGDLQKRLGQQHSSEMFRELDALLEESGSGQVKLFLIWRMLQFRQRHRSIFEQGSYEPIVATGSKRRHVCAFARSKGHSLVIAIAPRLVFGLTGGREVPPQRVDIWEDTCVQLPTPGEYLNILTGQRHFTQGSTSDLSLAEILSHFPVALLAS